MRRRESSLTKVRLPQKERRAAAVAARHLPTQPEGIRLEMSVAIYKNGRSVGIPGTNGLRGLTLACVLGALGGNPDKGLMALEDIPADTVEQAQAFIDAGKWRKRSYRARLPCGRG